MRQKNILRALAVFLVLATLGVTWWATRGGQAADRTRSDNVAEPSTEGLPVDAFTLGPSQPLRVPREYAGLVKPFQASQLGFELAGRVEKVFVDEGDHVAAGQLLAELDSRRLKAQRDQFVGELRAAEATLQELVAGPRQETLDAAQARVAQLQAQLELARIKYQRRESLRRNSATSQEELDVQRFEVDILSAQLAEATAAWDELKNGTREEQIAAQRATVERLEAAVEQAEIEISHTQLVAPFAGQIVSRKIEVGDIAAEGDGVIDLESAQREIWIGCPPETVQQLHEGETYHVTIAGQTRDATLRSVVAKLDQKTRTQALVFDLKSDDFRIPSGAIARIAIEQALDSTGYWVPASSLVSGSQGLWAAYAVVTDPQGPATLVRRDVELLHLEEDAAFVRGMLTTGDRIVASGVHRLVAGQHVTPQPIDWSYAIPLEGH